MRKLLVGILISVLCMTAFLPSALAEEVRVTVTSSQTELSDSGNVKFTFNISNFSDYELSDIVIVYNGTSHTELQQTVVPPNQSIQNYELELPVSEAQLGNPIVFTVSCVRNGEPITTEASVTIARSSDPVITLTREADATTVRQGESVKLTYVLKNETKFDMTDIQVIDQEISDTPQKLQLLRAGGSMSWDWSLVMGEDDALSAPTVTYTVNGKTKSFSGVTPVTLTALLVRLNMQISAGTPTAAGVSFTIDVKNTGNQEIKDITVKDERGNSVNDAPFSLKAGENASHSFLAVPVMTEASREVKFTLTGTDSLGQAYTLTSPDSYTVYPFVDETQINVTMKTETVTPWTSESGKVVARVVITNHSAVTLSNVSVLETGNVLKTYETLQAGETSFDTEVILGSPRNLQFAIKGTDPTGTVRELATSGLPVAYGTEAAEATPAPEQISAGGNMQAFSFLSSTISKILVALGILMVLSFVVLIALSIAERNRSGGIRFDDDDDDDDDLDDFFREAEPEKRAYFDDRDEVTNYTARIQNAGTRRTAANDARVPPPIPLPPAAIPEQPRVQEQPRIQEQPRVPVEYDGAQYNAPRADTKPPMWTPAASYAPPPPPAWEAPQAPAWEAPPRYVQTQGEAAPAETLYTPRDAYEEYDAFDAYTDKNALQTPKVIANRRAPAVRPQRRNEIRHVHKDPQK